ncbi:uncharacterized protein LOC112190241 [Rosa chinensis]|uniref:uncharacterized protein LOC112190241 n=1 Tax=Rosa chinensis TaxID=74649 RepID=UPI000D08BCBC|nr:uncharacterized protein LOC112190241 [Rosa chinensis]XP_024185435.1 uncharacterized protein LOC112190241 [Rosa chinensis]XP_040371690.1 uncharacterized protein LOC112190241 [Rosa chinensis]
MNGRINGGVVAHIDRRLTFDQWLRVDLILWDSHNNNGEQYYLGVGDDFRAVFRPIVKHLQKLHDKGQFNGNLRASIRIRSQIVGNNPGRRIFEVEFTGDMNFGGDNFENGLRRDLQDLEHLVRSATAGMPERNRPDSLKLYLLPSFRRYVFQGNIREEGRYFIYFNPLFYDGADRNRLYHKVWELRRRSDAVFQRHVTLASQETSMIDWYRRIPYNFDIPMLYQHPLWHVYSNRSSPHSTYATTPSIIRYLRNATHHYQDYSVGALSSQVNDQLYRLFPDACPKIFFEIVKNFRGENGRRYFGIDLVTFLKDGPFGFT